MNKINREQIKILLSKPAQYQYFFRNLDKPGWFDFLNELKIFDYVHEPELTEDGKYIQSFPWWPGEYLIKVANQIPDKVFGILKKIKTDNYFALDDCAQCILNMPEVFVIEHADEIINLFDCWLGKKYIRLIPHRVEDLLKRYIDSGSFENALRLLSVLSKTIKETSGDIKFRFDTYHYTELLKKNLPKLYEAVPAQLIELIENRLREIIKNGIKINGSKDDLSTLWCKTIEKINKVDDRTNIKEIFVIVIRDALISLSLKDSGGANVILQKWLNDEFSVFQRIAIHCIRTCDNASTLVRDILMDQSRLFNGKRGYHEYLLLLKERFKDLSDIDKLNFLKWVENGPPIDSFDNFEQHKQREQLRIFSIIDTIIKNEAETKLEFQHYLDYCNTIKTRTPELKNRDFSEGPVSWVGPTSSLTKEEIIKMSPVQFVDWIKNNLQPPFEMMGPSPEGVARIFQEVVKEKYIEYANAAEKFLDDKIWPAYLCGYIRGLEEAIKEGKYFDLEPVLRFIESPLKFHEEPEVKLRHDTFDIGQYSWFRGATYNFIEKVVKKDELVLTINFIDRTRTLLMESTKIEDDPSEAEEKEYGPDAQNMDYVTYCINSNRGKALHALIQHALRFARMRQEDEKKNENGKGPFPPGERMNLYREFLSKRLVEEGSPSVQSSYGQFLPYLFYLDQEWVKQMKRDDRLFPKAKEKNKVWEAHWQGYLFNNFYDQLYELLKQDYRKAVNNLVQGRDNKKSFHEDEGLVQHLMIAFWRKIEDINEDSGTLNAFFKNASLELRCLAIRFLGDGVKENKMSKDSDEWARLKALWKYRLEKTKDGELATFVTWLQYCPENLDDIIEFVIPIVSYLYMGYQEEDLLEYINEKIETNTKSALLLLNKLFEVKESLINVHFRFDLIKEILTKAKKYAKMSDITTAINKAVNRLLEMGYYEFRNFN